jgi:alcohol dehydrogenase class IV
VTAAGFTHLDHAGTIVFGPGAADALPEHVDGPYTLLTTERTAAAAPAVVDGAARVLHVASGKVDEVAGDLLGEIGDDALVALGGGRVIDVAKALAAARRRPGPVAIPTTLSAAEMTGVHRPARGAPEGTGLARVRVVLNDPALSASQPVADLAASSANALAHAVVSLVNTTTTPIARAVAREAIVRFDAGWREAEPDRSALALAALLAGWAVDRGGLGPHHVLSQTAVRLAGVGHAQANAALLPHTAAALRERAPEGFADAPDAVALAGRLRERAGVSGLGPLLGDAELLDRTVETAARRPELERVPPAFTPEDIRALYLAAG